MSSLLEKLAGAKVLIDAAIEEEIARTEPPPDRQQGGQQGDCKHENRHEITGAGQGRKRVACADCGEEWEVD
jgi:hypothetical protein